MTEQSSTESLPSLEAASPLYLRFFIEIARQGSFHGAAKALGVEDSKLSRKIRALERDIGLVLLYRKPGSPDVSLTRAGRALLPEAERVVAAAAALGSHAEGIKRGEKGIISVACYPVHICRFMAAVIADFRKTHPNVHVDLSRMLDPLSETTYKERFDMLERGRVDLAVGPRQPTRNFEWIKLYTCNMVVAVPARSSLRERDRIPVSDLEGMSILIAPRPYPSRAIVEDACARAGFSLERSVEVESTNPVALLALSTSGLGVPVVPDDHPPVGRRTDPFPLLVDDKNDPLVIDVCLHWRPSDELPENVGDFIDCAKTWVKRDKEKKFSTAIDLLGYGDPG